MTLNLLKRAEKGAALTAAEHDTNFTAIETEVNAKADSSALGTAAASDTGDFIAAADAPSGDIVGTTDAQTLSGKTIDGTREAVEAIVDGAAVEIDMAGPGFQTWSLGATRTATLGNVAAGRQVKLSVTSNTHGLTLTGVSWGDAGAPTLGSVTDIELWSDDGTTVKGAVAWKAA